MHYDANLRVRELTQNIFDIGDEIAQAIDHVAQAMADWDLELVEDCILELKDLIAENRAEVRPALSELNGLRQAFVSGVRAGEMSNTAIGNPWRPQHSDAAPHPGRTLSFMHRPSAAPAKPARASFEKGVRGLAFASSENHPMATPSGAASGPSEAEPGPGVAMRMASTASWRVWLRDNSEKLIAEIKAVEEWVVGETARAIGSNSVLLAQVYSQAQRRVEELAGSWSEVVAQQPTLVRSMRGEAPPEFLAERACVDAVVAKLQQRRRGAAV